MSKKIKNIKIIDPGSPPDVDTDFSKQFRQSIIYLYISCNMSVYFTRVAQ